MFFGIVCTFFHLNNLFDLRDNNPSFDEYNKMLSCTPQTLTSKLSIDFNLLISLGLFKSTLFNLNSKSYKHNVIQEKSININSNHTIPVLLG